MKKRPQAKILIGQHFLGNKISATAEGYVIYEEYDQTDKKNYYWEEWELRGFDDYDSWVEYDHYTQKITLYEPLKPKQQIDSMTLAVREEVAIDTERGGVIQGVVKEVGIGKVVRREGTLTYHVFQGDNVAYAEITSSDGKTYLFEKYNDKEFDLYRGTTLSRKEQKTLLGKAVSPKRIKVGLIVWLIIGGFIAFSMIMSRNAKSYQTFCTPRSVTPSPTQKQSLLDSISPTVSAQTPTNTTLTPQSTDEVISQDSKQTCYRRTVVGGAAAGTRSSGGSVGK